MGKASIIYVMGLSFILAYALLNISGASTDSVTNFTNYYGRTMTHDIASSGANIGCSAAFFDSAYSTPYTNVPMLGGTMNVTFTVAGNSKFVRSIGGMSIGPRAFVDTVIAELRNQTMARYAWFTNLEANRSGQITSWSTGDTAWGPAHTNDKFNINKKPVFMKKATAWAAAVPKNNTAIWAGGYQWSIKIPYPTSLENFKTAAQTGGRTVVGHDALVDFSPSGLSGHIRLQVPSTGIDTIFHSASDFTANGAFAVIGGNLSVKGTFEGDIAVGALPTAGVGGFVSITGDIRYKTNPKTDPSSTDYLGIYATNDITVTYDPANPGLYDNRKIDASVFSLTGEFNVQDVRTPGYPPRGQLTTLGAMMQYYRGEVGVVNGAGTLQHGYNKNFRYDERLIKHPPKFFPATGRYTLYAWKEN